jgi:hypothetical protein
MSRNVLVSFLGHGGAWALLVQDADRINHQRLIIERCERARFSLAMEADPTRDSGQNFRRGLRKRI